jgi:4-hydroxybenzoate polyprenyltransferase
MQYDAKLSVGSTALLFGSYIRPVLYMFSVAFIASLAFVGYQLSYSLIFWVISVGGATTHILWQVYTFDPSDNKNCQDRFLVSHIDSDTNQFTDYNRLYQSNIHLGFIVSSGMALDYCRSLYSR